MRVQRSSSQQLIHLLIQQTLTERPLWAMCCSGHHPSKQARITDLVERPSEAGAAILPVPQGGRLRLGEIKELRHSPKVTLGCRPLWTPQSMLSVIHPPWGSFGATHEGPGSRHWRPGPPRGWPCPALFSSCRRVPTLPFALLPLSPGAGSSPEPRGSCCSGQRGGGPRACSTLSQSPSSSLSSLSPERVSECSRSL